MTTSRKEYNDSLQRPSMRNKDYSFVSPAKVVLAIVANCRDSTIGSQVNASTIQYQNICGNRNGLARAVATARPLAKVVPDPGDIRTTLITKLVAIL